MSPSRRGKRIRATVKIGSGKHAAQKEKGFPLGTSLKEIRDWQSVTRAALAKKRGRAPMGTPKGVFAADVERYLRTIGNRPKFGSAKSCLEALCKRFGHRRRHTITLAEWQAQLDEWEGTEDEPGRYAGSTLAHCKDHLVDLIRTLDGVEDSDNVATKLRRVAQADPEPRAIPDDLVDAILDAMPPSKARACLKVLAYTGIPPARQRRLKPGQVDLKVKTVFLTRRRKGKGTVEKTFPLTDRGVLAFQEFIDQNAWGGVEKESMALSFRRGIKKLNKQRQKDGQAPLPLFRPYDLRHSFGAATYRATGDLGAVAELLDVTLETAKRYAMSAVPDQLQKAADALNKAHPAPQPETPPAPPLRLVAKAK